MCIELKLNDDGQATEVFIAGYVTTPNNYKDFIIKKYSASNGDSLGQKTYGLKFGDDIATDILLDGNYAYVLGYSYFGPHRMNDITLLTFWQSDLSLNEVLFDNRPGSDDKPTGFVIAERSSVPVQKSKISLTSVSDNTSAGGGTKFLTMFIEPSFVNHFIIRWQKEYTNCKSCRNDYATSVSQDFTGDIYVAGYVDRSFIRNHGCDFATIKYKAAEGAYGWTEGVKFYNYSDTSTRGVNDKASSIKINDNKTVYVAGVSEASPSGFSYVQYSQTAGDPLFELDRVYTPGFILNDRTLGDGMNKWSTLHLANDGTPLIVMMGWNETNAYWSAIRYDANGNVLYTINDDPGDFNQPAVNKNEQALTLNNYPNPFNPSTAISYTLIENSFVNLKVYNSLGREVASLVNEKQNPGNHTVNFNAGNLSSGVYYYTMTVNGIVRETKTMMLLK
ncbi:MAG: T9SS type A sorting domain-containing protein [Ignavibacteria bacterium]|nr:T9SS type A sorting domain-containing protein [Ignavibacteria bacterium]